MAAATTPVMRFYMHTTISCRVDRRPLLHFHRYIYILLYILRWENKIKILLLGAQFLFVYVFFCIWRRIKRSIRWRRVIWAAKKKSWIHFRYIYIYICPIYSRLAINKTRKTFWGKPTTREREKTNDGVVESESALVVFIRLRLSLCFYFYLLPLLVLLLLVPLFCCYTVYIFAHCLTLCCSLLVPSVIFSFSSDRRRRRRRLWAIDLHLFRRPRWIAKIDARRLPIDAIPAWATSSLSLSFTPFSFLSFLMSPLLCSFHFSSVTFHPDENSRETLFSNDSQRYISTKRISYTFIRYIYLFVEIIFFFKMEPLEEISWPSI